MNRRRTLDDLAWILTPIPTGTRDRPQQTRRIDLADQHMHTWTASRPPGSDSHRGGSSSPTETEDRREDQLVARRAVADQHRTRALLDMLAPIADELRSIVVRYVTPIDHTKLPKTDGLPGCVSCARTQTRGKTIYPGHFHPVDKRYAGRQLCRWCGDIHAATGQYPPLDAVDTYHRVGPQAAGRRVAGWIARQARKPR